MPIVDSNYKIPYAFRSGFVSTVYSGIIRSIKDLQQQRERITLSDGDFLDIDWSFSQVKTDKLIILLHGLEGNAQRPYITGTAKLFNDNNIDAASVNFRGCSGEGNLKYRSYHSGATDDLEAVISHIIQTKQYSEIYINGFSLGGNVALKYLGEGKEVPTQVKGVIAVSVPCNLKGSCVELHKLKNRAFSIRFLNHLKRRLKIKQRRFPEDISKADINSIKTLKQFDDVYTAKAHGFKDAFDYYKQASSLQFLPNIKVPTLILNALNDSFLSPDCFPIEEAKNNPNLYLEMPTHGGHVGFINGNNIYYNESRALEFIRQIG